MKWVIGTAFAIVVVAFAIAVIRGRVKARSCCTPIPAERDTRLAD